MEKYAFFICVIVFIIAILLVTFIKPIRKTFKFIINSILGFLFMCVINTIGANYNFHIGINWVTIIGVGILGIPGCILIFLAKILL